VKRKLGASQARNRGGASDKKSFGLKWATVTSFGMGMNSRSETCENVDCDEPIERGSYCKEHAVIFYRGFA
jgi:hypothetical protein